jgi:2-polyprenyl-3-methyl-5-hydroxy-6-metoxy-1,4-benzoquinol methylase
MAIIDHSLTYRSATLRHLPHRLRLRAIKAIVRTIDLPEGPTYADFGCSNGYVSEQVRRLIAARETYGFDHHDKHFEIGRSLYPDIQFSRFDLNRACGSPIQCDLVTCFETLEHVGHLDHAVANLVSAVAPGGILVISVPIEIGAVGLAKFAFKLAYGYELSELPVMPRLLRRYVWALVTGARISRFRDNRLGWGTHFGFDYRDLDDVLSRSGIEIRQWNNVTTRFYIARIRSCATS